MRKIVLLLHTSLDGFVAGPNGEMDWIKFDDELFELVGTFTEDADTALYGRVTYQMMESYWPTAGDQPGATKHAVQHSRWYGQSEKLVISRSMKDVVKDKTTIIGDRVVEEIRNIKTQAGKNILMIGSPSSAHLLVQHKLVDEYRLFISPVILGKGIRLFPATTEKMELMLGSCRTFGCGVTGLHYTIA